MLQQRIDANLVKVTTANGHEFNLYASEQVPIDAAAFTQLEEVISVVEAAEQLYVSRPYLFDDPPSFDAGALSPDLHPGDPVPIGTILKTRGFIAPQIIGRDGGCGMRLWVVDLPPDKVRAKLSDLAKKLRYMFFEGGRDLPLTRRQRLAMFYRGSQGLLDTIEASDGRLLALGRDLGLVEPQAFNFTPKRLPGLDDFLGPEKGATRDGQTGSLGGGNHFFEIQDVVQVLDGSACHLLGIKQNQTALMTHTGSVAIGHLAGGIGADMAKKLWPKGVPYPTGGIFPLPVGNDPAYAMYFDVLAATLNFAAANRMICALMAVEAIFSVVGEAAVSCVYDTPHNFIIETGDRGFLHRKGACPARGAGNFTEAPYNWIGEPVIIPGSMGADSFLLTGLGLEGALHSACHGAGRNLSRGAAAHGHEKEFQDFMDNYKIVSPLDLESQEALRRPDILAAKIAQLREEGPFAYKSIGPVIKTVSGAGIAKPAAILRPLLTVKG